MTKLDPNSKPLDNPLLKPSTYPNQAQPFSEIKEEHFLPALEIQIKRASEQIEKICSLPDEPNFENTALALEQSGEGLDLAAATFYNLLSAQTSDQLQELAQKVGPLLSRHSNDIILNEKLFKRVKSVWENSEGLRLNSEQRRLVDETYTDFVRNGALLSEDQKTQLREIDSQLSQLGPEFSNNVLKDTNSFELWLTKESELEGLPESAVAAAKASAEEKKRPNEWLFTLQAPSFIPFMKSSAHRHLREKLWRAFSTRAFNTENDNQDLIQKILKLREERAQLLGFKHHADFILKKRMAESADQAKSFVEKLVETYQPAAKKELVEIEVFAKNLGAELPLKPWDISFYSEKLRKHLYDFDEEILKPYFPLPAVIKGAFGIAEKLYGIEFRESKEYPLYHPDVKSFEVFDSQTKEFVGLFYTDFFPRPEKKGGAWMTNYRDQGLSENKMKRPHVSIVCNFTKPLPDKPSLLTFDEVQTLFHEFGHALHSLLSQVTYRSLSGTNVYWDFVELPSQIMENWAMEPEALESFARHYQTNEVIPKELIQKLRSSAQFMAGWMGLRQSQFALLDLTYHLTPAAQITDIESFEAQALSSTQLMAREPGTSVSCSFAHIFAGGYAAGYYSYKWAETLDADAFELFKEKGIFHSETAQSFKENILSQGGTDHPSELYKKFRGRAPDPQALFRREGLSK